MKRPTGVPIELIENANLTYVRDAVRLADVAELARSIQEDGLRHAVLLDEHYQVIDGARRIQAFKKLGLDEVPALSTSKWAVIRDRMKAERQADSTLPHMPLTWQEIVRFHEMMAPIHYRALRAREPGLTPGRRLADGPKSGYSAIMRDLAEMTGIPVSHLVTVTNMWAQVRIVKSGFPERSAEVDRILDTLSGDGVGQIHAATRKITALRFLDSEVEPNLRKAQEQLRVIRSGIETMKTVGQLMGDLGELNPALLPAEIKELHNGLVRAITSLGPVRTRLQKRYEANKHDASAREEAR